SRPTTCFRTTNSDSTVIDLKKVYLDSSQHLRLRKLTLDDRLLPSVRGIRVEEARETVMILSRIDGCPIYIHTRQGVHIFIETRRV
ncbi:hypothetical protein ALC57_02519, partial [Trachymyrmex cornetzi]